MDGHTEPHASRAQDAAQSARLKDLLFDVLEEPEERREAFLDRACGGDADLRRRVAELARAHAQADRRIGAGPALPVRAAPRTRVASGDEVGPYVLERELGEGGFGTVFLARQERPVRRRVALKLLKLGRDTERVLERFQAERQTLALMEHPHIAKVYDAGESDAGPYLAMEFVDGQPITRYCRDRSLPLRARLELFRTTCLAIQHAHQKGVLHRDIKPSNVLVSTVDGQPAPKVIDFGISKVTSAEPGAAFATQQGQFLGTPAYMSPEQASADPDVDTRSDVYALGVLLYELLAGRPPFEPQSASPLEWAEMLRRVREVDPPPPSAAMRRGELPRELDWVVMRALAKDRDRRYPSARALAADVQRALDHEPVEAAPPGAWYRARKLARRHRAASAVLAAVVLAIAVAMAGLGAGLLAARRANERLDREAQRASAAAAIARESLTFLVEDLLGAVAPSAEKGRGPDVGVREVLDVASARIESASQAGGRFVELPTVEAGIRKALGKTYAALGLFEPAQRHFERAVALTERAEGPDAPEMWVLRSSLASVLAERDRLEPAEREARRAAEALERQLGPAHHDAIVALRSLGKVLQYAGRFEDAERAYSQALDRARTGLGERDPTTLLLAGDAALINDYLGRFEVAGRMFRETLALRRAVSGDDDPITLAAMANLASHLMGRRQHAEAEPILVEALERQARVMGEGHPYHIKTLHNLAICRFELGRRDEAREMLEEGLVLARRVFGEEGTDTLSLLGSQANFALQDRRYEEAHELYLDLIERTARVLGAEHPTTLSRHLDLANSLYLQRRYAEAGAVLDELAEAQLRVFGPEHPSRLRTLISAAMCDKRLGKMESAEARLTEAARVCLGVLPEGDRDTLTALGQLADLFLVQKRFEEAEHWAREELAAARAAAPSQPRPDALILALGRVGEALFGQARGEEGDTWFREAQSVADEAFGQDSERAQFYLSQILALYEKYGLVELAEAWLATR